MTKPPFGLNAVGRPALILTKGGFLVSKDFYSHQHSWWIIPAEAVIEKCVPVSWKRTFSIIIIFIDPTANGLLLQATYT